jgi:hypothetical protein
MDCTPTNSYGFLRTFTSVRVPGLDRQRERVQGSLRCWPDRVPGRAARSFSLPNTVSARSAASPVTVTIPASRSCSGGLTLAAFRGPVQGPRLSTQTGAHPAPFVLVPPVSDDWSGRVHGHEKIPAGNTCTRARRASSSSAEADFLRCHLMRSASIAPSTTTLHWTDRHSPVPKAVPIRTGRDYSS